jgi:hypothetical protein
MSPREQDRREAHRREGDPEGLQFKRETGADVYEALVEYQTSEPWPAKELITELHRFARVFNSEFQLGIPELALGIDRLRWTTLGHFRYGHNCFALKGEIIINDRHLDDREGWQTLGTLLHEMIHAWQQAYGRPGRRNYHNREFRNKAAVYGLIVDQRGYTQFEPDSPFTRLLAEHGVNVPSLKPAAEAPRQQAGTSKLKKWSCGCTNVRVAVKHFRARCLNCEREFQPSGW